MARDVLTFTIYDKKLYQFYLIYSRILAEINVVNVFMETSNEKFFVTNFIDES
jgi:hypothetical protein